MKNIALIISDTHHHDWSQFAETLSDGRNSRNEIIIEETYKAAQELKERGGNVIIHAGDIFHTRGKLKPSILNPVIQLYKKLVDEDFDVHVVPGNHDMEANDSGEYTNAVTALEGVGVHVYTETTYHNELNILFIPWLSKVDEYRKELEWHNDAGKEFDVVTHSPLNGVIEGLPDHGLSHNELLEFDNVRNFFTGHYHNHKVFLAGERSVVSIGALTHQNFGDVNSKAGYLLYDMDRNALVQAETFAPKFKSFDTDVDDFEDFDFRNAYVRIKTDFTTERDMKQLRQMAIDEGAVGVVVMPTKKSSVVERTEVTTEHKNLRESVTEFIGLKEFKHEDEVKVVALRVLEEVETAE